MWSYFRSCFCSCCCCKCGCSCQPECSCSCSCENEGTQANIPDEGTECQREFSCSCCCCCKNEGTQANIPDEETQTNIPVITQDLSHQARNDLSRTYGAMQGTQHRGETPNHTEVEKLIEEKDNLTRKNEKLTEEKEFSDARCHKEDVVFDPETAHSRLKVYEDGKCVKDTGNVSHVSESKKRFDSHIFILAKNRFSKGKHYWEVEVGEKKNWALGVASDSIHRQGLIKLSPQDGYWVIKFEDGNQYWAQESRLSVKVNEKPTKIGIFLNISDKSLSFYDVHRKIKLYTFTDSFSGTFYPFFYTGLEPDSFPLRIPPCFEEDC